MEGGDRRVELLAEALQDRDGGTVLDRVCIAALRRLGVTGTAVAVMSQEGGGGPIASAGPSAAEVHGLHFELGEGPSKDAFDGDVEVVIDDLVRDGPRRWPVFTQAALALGVAAVFAFPASLGAIDLGILLLVRDRVGPLSAAQLLDARVLAEVVSVLVLDRQAGTDDDAITADGWPTRAAVHQATGMVAVQLQVPLATALARLRAHAFSSDRPLDDVARDVVSRAIRFDA